MSYEGCTAYSHTAQYNIGVTPAVAFRQAGIYEGVSQNIALPQGKPQGGTYEGIGISGGGGTWFFNAYTAGAGEHIISYKVRNEQASNCKTCNTYSTAYSTAYPTAYCAARQHLKVWSFKEILHKAKPTTITQVPNRLVLKPNMPHSTVITIDGIGKYARGCRFLVQLSAPDGNFAYTTPDSLPDIVGQIDNPLFANIPITIRTDTPSSRRYRLRIIETAPFSLGADNGFDIQIKNPLLFEERTKPTLPFAVLLKK